MSWKTAIVWGVVIGGVLGSLAYITLVRADAEIRRECGLDPCVRVETLYRPLDFEKAFDTGGLAINEVGYEVNELSVGDYYGSVDTYNPQQARHTPKGLR